MIAYNLTDKTPPWEKSPRTPNKIKIRGVILHPGQQHEFSDFPLKEVAGLINSHRISVDGIPDWYQKATISEKEKRFAVHFKQVATKTKLVKKPEPEPVVEEDPIDDDEETKSKRQKGKKK